MKSAIVMAIAVFGATAANAKTLCTLNTGTGTSYDRSLFYGDLSVPRILVVSKDGQSAKQIEFSQLKTVEAWKTIDGSTFVSMSMTDETTAGITVGHIDMSQTSNILPLDAISTGPVGEKQSVSLTVPSKKLSAACFQMN